MKEGGKEGGRKEDRKEGRKAENMCTSNWGKDFAMLNDILTILPEKTHSPEV